LKKTSSPPDFSVERHGKVTFAKEERKKRKKKKKRKRHIDAF